MSIQPPRISCGNEITSNTMAKIEIKKKRECRKRKDCVGDTTDTSAETEIKKKRPYRRKDCAGDTTNTSTETEVKEKRAHKRKDRGGNTSTTVTKRRKDCAGDTIDTPTVTEAKKIPSYRRKKYLPHDLIMEEICSKLPVPTLLKSVLVSKLWYNSIHNDHKRLTYTHFLQSQEQPHVILSLLNVRDYRVVNQETGERSYGCHFFRFTAGAYDRENENALQFEKFRGGAVGDDIFEMVGYCHGFPCMAAVDKYSAIAAYIIMDPNRKDFLHIYPAISARNICHGFGFDPSAKEYKLVSLFRTTQKELNFMVFTLGTKSWRNVTDTSMPISGYGGRPITKIRAVTGSDKSAVFCTTSSSSSSGVSGCLVWKIIATFGRAEFSDTQHDNSNAVSNEMEMLLSFSLHDEKFRLIQLPAKSTTGVQQKHLLVDYPHLLEFKGSPCIARIEKLSGNGTDYPHRCRGDHKGDSSSCCCCCKVHLYVLKNNVKQVWVKEESFDVRIDSTPTSTWSRNRAHQAPKPCCFCFGSTNTPPTRIYSKSDQMLLYWFDGNSLQVYNLRSEKLQLVVPFNYREEFVFQLKMKDVLQKFNSGQGDIYCSRMDYQLHCHEENLLSLQTFIPEGVEGIDADDFSKLDLERCSAYMLICRGSNMFYPFF